MPKRSPRNTSRVRSLPQHLQKGATTLGRWATTDHLHIAELSAMPGIGFWNTLIYIGAALVLRLLGLLGSLAIIYFLVIYGIPWLLFGQLP